MKACFSPEVPRSIRVVWGKAHAFRRVLSLICVKLMSTVFNGGALTHTALDFYLADFFFCASLDDSWLPE